MTSIEPIKLPLTHPGTSPIVIAGPCSAESRSQMAEAAGALAAGGVRLLRGGAWKPRTRPGGFEGFGRRALEWVAEAAAANSMAAATEVASPAHVRQALDAGIQVLWIGARTTANPFAVQEIAEAIASLRADTPVLVKNPINPDIELWDGALQRLWNAGVRNIGAIHRGFSTYGNNVYRNMPLWHIPVELAVRHPSLTILCDPSHIGGDRRLVEPIARQAIDTGFHGLIVETHPHPDSALSDAAQQVTPARLIEILGTLTARSEGASTAAETLDILRRQLDDIDTALLDMLARRMDVAREIGRVKKTHGMAVVQSSRFRSVMTSRLGSGAELGLSEQFLKTLLLAVHDESVRQQLEVLRKH